MPYIAGFYESGRRRSWSALRSCGLEKGVRIRWKHLADMGADAPARRRGVDNEKICGIKAPKNRDAHNDPQILKLPIVKRFCTPRRCDLSPVGRLALGERTICPRATYIGKSRKTGFREGRTSIPGGTYPRGQRLPCIRHRMIGRDR